MVKIAKENGIKDLYTLPQVQFTEFLTKNVTEEHPLVPNSLQQI